MGFADYQRDIQDPDVSHDWILNRYFHAGQSYAFSGADPSEEVELKMGLASDLSAAFDHLVHPLQLVVCGSAHLGFSPVWGEKYGAPFDPRRSDIDVAVIHGELFERCWSELQNGREEPPDQVRDDLFWGLINPALIKDACRFGEKWWTLFGALRTDRARGVRGRLYRNHWSMQNYHRVSIVRAIENNRAT